MVIKILLLMMNCVVVASCQSTISDRNSAEYECGLCEDVKSDLEHAHEVLKVLHQAAVRSETQATQLKSEIEEIRQTMARQHYWSRSECPPGFDYLQDAGSCYKVIFERITWDDATDRCRQMMPGVHLAAITSERENNAIARYLQSQFNSRTTCTEVGNNWPEAGNLIWISGQTKNPRRCGVPYVWRPLNGIELPFNYLNWNQSYPDCYENRENCAQITTGLNYSWNDYDCAGLSCAICELHV